MLCPSVCVIVVLLRLCGCVVADNVLMCVCFAETDDYAEIVDEEDTYTMPSSK